MTAFKVVIPFSRFWAFGSSFRPWNKTVIPDYGFRAFASLASRCFRTVIPWAFLRVVERCMLYSTSKTVIPEHCFSRIDTCFTPLWFRSICFKASSAKTPAVINLRLIRYLLDSSMVPSQLLEASLTKINRRLTEGCVFIGDTSGTRLDSELASTTLLFGPKSTR